MITAPYIRDKKPSWISGRENAILPYLLRARHGETGVISPYGEYFAMDDDNFEKCLQTANQGVVMGRISHTFSPPMWHRKVSLTTDDPSRQPSGAGGVWLFTNGDTYRHYGEMYQYDLTTGQTVKGEYWGFDDWVMIPPDSTPVEQIVDEAALPAREDVVFSEWHCQISASEEILDVIFLDKGHPFTGMIRNGAYSTARWENGRFISKISESDEMDDVDFTLTVHVVTRNRTLVKSVDICGLM